MAIPLVAITAALKGYQQQKKERDRKAKEQAAENKRKTEERQSEIKKMGEDKKESPLKKKVKKKLFENDSE